MRRVVVAIAGRGCSGSSTVPSAQAIPVQDSGAAGAWQKILKARTTASVMHTTAHPDDEHGGVITRLSRRDGARLALMTLNRGESGDNAIGPQLFDGLGLIRTEELRVADRYYGVDEQYFTTVVDYGFSKRLEEAFDKWGKDNVMRDVVRVIRTSRPWVLLSRFQGNERDGHGNHQTAGLITVQAFKLAGDPAMYPEQIKEGLRPWQPFKVYIGGVRENEDWTVRIDSGEFSPYLGDSYDNVARYGLSFQRSQNSGRYNPGAGGPNYGYYSRVGSRVAAAPAKEQGIFDGLNTSYSGLFATLGRRSPEGVADQLARVDGAFGRATADFRFTDPSAAAPGLAAALQFIREAIAKSAGEDEALFVLRIKERQTEEAITACLGLELTATAQPAGVAEPTGPFAAFAPPPSMAAPVPGQAFEVRARLANRGRLAVAPAEIALETLTGWTAAPAGDTGIAPSVDGHSVLSRRFTVNVAADAPISTRPYFHRRRAAGEPLHARRSRRVRPGGLGAAAGRGGPLRDRGIAGDGARSGPPPRGQAALRRRPARGAHRPAAGRHGVADHGGGAAVGGDQARRAAGGRRPQRRGADDRDGGADRAVGLEGGAGERAAHLRPRRRARQLPLHRVAVDHRRQAVPRRGGGHGRGPQLPRGLRADRPARPRAALPLSPVHGRRARRST